MNVTVHSDCSKTVTLKEDDFGFFLDKTTGNSIPVRRFTWKNQNDVQVQVITYGATITSLKVPDKNGVVKDIVLGYDTIEGYLQPMVSYFGATIGRVANRIANGRFKIDGQQFNVSKNRGNFILHGGFKGFDKVIWEHDIQGKAVIFSYLSKDNEEGFPGDLIINLKCELTDNNEFKIDTKAYTTKPTIINMTNHSYFNLGGHNEGPQELYNHSIQINANSYTAVNSDSITTGEIVPVAGTVYDLQTPKLMKDVINSVPGGGYDINFCINTDKKQSVIFVGRAIHVPSGRTMEVYSNQPGLQFYTSNYLPVKDSKNEQVKGKGNCVYYRHGAFCFEAQNYPNAINNDNFPSPILRPGEIYTNITYFVFPAYKKHC